MFLSRKPVNEAISSIWTHTHAASFEKTKELNKTAVQALTPLNFPNATAACRSRYCTATRFTRQQMIDMGLVPPEGAEQQQGQEQGQVDQNGASVDEGGGQEGTDLDAEESAEAIGLIGHFEASHLLSRKGKEGTFMGSLDMSMTERDLVSTEEGVGEIDSECPRVFGKHVRRSAAAIVLRCFCNCFCFWCRFCCFS